MKTCLIVLQVSHLALVTPSGKEFYHDTWRLFCGATLLVQISECERAQRAWERVNGPSRPARWAACATIK
jgi:hypothetical protein